MLKAAPESATEPDRVRSAVDACDAQAADLQQLVNDCARFLPGFDARKAQSAVDAVVADGAALRERAAPRKRFAFSRKAEPTAAGSSSAAKADVTAPTAALAAAASGIETTAPSAAAASVASAAPAKPRWAEDEHTIEGLSGRLIFVPLGGFTASAPLAAGSECADSSSIPAVQTAELANAGAIAALAARAAASLPAAVRVEPAASRVTAVAAGSGADSDVRAPAAAAAQGPSATEALTISMRRAKDLRLLNLTDCVVILGDVTRAIRVDNLTRCLVVCAGPTAGSVLLHACEDSAFLLQSRQIRLHTSRRCTFLLSVMSRPIIEHCSGLRFGPNPLTYPALPDCLRAAELPNIHAAPVQPQTAIAVALAAVAAASAVGAGPSMPRDAAGAAALPPGSVHSQWQAVDDFLWLRAQRSPNWDVLPPEEWPVDIAAVLALASVSSAATGGSDSAGASAAVAGGMKSAAEAIAAALHLRLELDSPGLTAIAAATRSAAAERAAAAAASAASAASTAASVTAASAVSADREAQAAAAAASTAPGPVALAAEPLKPTTAAVCAAVVASAAAAGGGVAKSAVAEPVALSSVAAAPAVVPSSTGPATAAAARVASSAGPAAGSHAAAAVPATAAPATVSPALAAPVVAAASAPAPAPAPASAAAPASVVVAAGLSRVVLPVAGASSAAARAAPVQDDDDEL